MNRTLKLFLTFLKIGVSTYGGGYAMIGIVEREVVDRQKLMDEDTYMDTITVCQSLPGPLAITSSAFLGYRLNKLPGAIACLLGTLIPSFFIIFLVATIFMKFESNIYVQHALEGIKAVVPILVLVAVLKFWKKLKKDAHNIIYAIIVLVLLEYFHVNPALIIIFSAIYGIIVYRILHKSEEGE